MLGNSGCRGARGSLTTEGESVGFGGVLLDMTGMSRVLAIDRERMSVRVEGGLYCQGRAFSRQGQRRD